MRIGALILSLVLAFGVGYLGSLFTAGAVDTWYQTLVRPPFSPPNWIFAPVWSALYALMAVAAWRVWLKRAQPGARGALCVYLAHLAVNLSWSVVFFGLEAPLPALEVILVLLALIAYLLVRFYRIDRAAGLLFAPYLAWVLFATYLNAAIVLLNP